MPHVEEELFAQVLLDREFLGEVEDLEILGSNFVPSGGPFVLDDFSPHDGGGLDEGLFRRRERLLGNRIAGDRDLQDPRRVPEDYEDLPSDRPRAVDPASQLDGLAGMAPLDDFSDGNHEPSPHSGGSRLPLRTGGSGSFASSTPGGFSSKVS